jgi:hypothetical protein
MAYRSTAHERTGYSPKMLMLGNTPRFNVWNDFRDKKKYSCTPMDLTIVQAPGASTCNCKR